MSDFKHHGSIEKARLRLDYFKKNLSCFEVEDEKNILSEMINVCVSKDYNPEDDKGAIFAVSPFYFYDQWDDLDGSYPGLIFPLFSPVEKWYNDFSLAIAIYKKDREYIVSSILCKDLSGEMELDFKTAMVFRGPDNIKEVFNDVLERTVEELEAEGLIQFDDFEQ